MAGSTAQSVNISTAGDSTVIRPTPDKPIYVVSLILSLAYETTVQFKRGSTAISGPISMLEMVLDLQEGGQPWFVANPGEAFVISLGAAVPCAGTIWYTTG